jgi:hypothetical protein
MVLGQDEEIDAKMDGKRATRGNGTHPCSKGIWLHCGPPYWPSLGSRSLFSIKIMLEKISGTFEFMKVPKSQK